jgi:hypothetical protein
MAARSPAPCECCARVDSVYHSHHLTNTCGIGVGQSIVGNWRTTPPGWRSIVATSAASNRGRTRSCATWRSVHRPAIQRCQDPALRSLRRRAPQTTSQAGMAPRTMLRSRSPSPGTTGTKATGSTGRRAASRRTRERPGGGGTERVTPPWVSQRQTAEAGTTSIADTTSATLPRAREGCEGLKEPPRNRTAGASAFLSPGVAPHR